MFTKVDDSDPARSKLSQPLVHVDEWVAPDICDDHGFLRAGTILEWMDVAGVLAAMRHSSLPVATASVDGLDIGKAIPVGSKVSMTSRVVFTSQRSMGVAVAMDYSLRGEKRPCLHGYMTFVALNETGQSMPVPPFVAESPAEQTGFREGQLRREFRKKLEAGELKAPPQDGSPQEQILFVRELLKLLPKSLRLPWEQD